MKVGIAITDMGAGMWAAIAILAALGVRERDGKGQYLDVSMMDGSIAWMTYLAATYLSTGNVPPRLGNAHQSIVPYQSFEAGDAKSILIAGGNDRLFQSLCEALGLPDLPSDPRYRGNGDRVRNRDTLLPIIAARFRTRPRDEWIKALEAKDFPVAPVYSMDEIFDDPQVKHRGLVREIDHPKAGKVKLVGPPLRLSETPCTEGSPPPVLGEHTEEVLTRVAGYSKAEVEALRIRGVI